MTLRGCAVWLVATTFIGSCALAECVREEFAPCVEARAIWIDAGAIPKTIDGIRKLVRTYRDANINILLPEVVSRGYAIHKSKLLARDPRFRDAPDPLPVIISEAHRLGMEVHPWVWVFRTGHPADRGAILSAHPDWAELNKDGSELTPDGALWISPCSEPARQFLSGVFEEIVRDYDVDGLHLDYIRYHSESSAPFGYSAVSRSLFEKQYGVDPFLIRPFSIEQYQWVKFRERQINTFVQKIALQTRQLKPHVKLSAAVAPNPTSARLDMMQNWPNWLDNKWLDFVVPMSYSTDDAYFQRLLDMQIAATEGRSLVLAGIGIGQKWSSDQTIAQIGYARQKLTAGQALFCASYFKPEIANALKRAYPLPSKVPYRDLETAIQQVRSQAAECLALGNADAVTYLTDLAEKLSTYHQYQLKPIGYVPPTELPMIVVDNPLPLPCATVSQTSVAPTIDGSIDDAAWINAVTLSLDYTHLGEQASVKTAAYLVYDDARVYFALHCEEPEISEVTSRSLEHDGNVFYDDSVEVFLKPSQTTKDYFHFAVNTAGVKLDEKNFNRSWNTCWQAVCKIHANSWTAELAIPLAALKSPDSAHNGKWRINLARNRTVSGNPETFVWSVPYGSLHSPERFGTLAFE